MTTLLARDEREVAVDHAADRLSYLVLAYGLLAIAAVRGFNGEASWDLLGLVVLGGVVGLAYRLRERVVSRPWTAVLLGSIVVAAAIAAVVAFASR
jgi:hypothetical protein